MFPVFDPRGDLPPFERQIRHEPVDGDLLLFPPWLSHAVASSDTSSTRSGSSSSGARRPRISISFNYVDDDLEGGRGRYGWGEATAGLDVLTIEDGLGMVEEGEEEEVGEEEEESGLLLEELQRMEEVLRSEEMRQAVARVSARRSSVNAEEGDEKEEDGEALAAARDRVHGLLARIGFESEGLMEAMRARGKGE